MRAARRQASKTDFFLNQAARHTALDTFRNYPHIGDGPLTSQAIREAARRGEVCFSNGGFVNVSVDGVPMGSVCCTAPDKRHRLRIEMIAAAKYGERHRKNDLILILSKDLTPLSV